MVYRLKFLAISLKIWINLNTPIRHNDWYIKFPDFSIFWVQFMQTISLKIMQWKTAAAALNDQIKKPPQIPLLSHLLLSSDSYTSLQVGWEQTNVPKTTASIQIASCITYGILIHIPLTCTPQHQKSLLLNPISSQTNGNLFSLVIYF